MELERKGYNNLKLALAGLNLLRSCPSLFHTAITTMVATSKKGLKIGRALRSAARLPIRVSARRGSGRSSYLPTPGESPISILRVQILSCQDLEGKARNGSSDPCAPRNPIYNHHVCTNSSTVSPPPMLSLAL
jgi:hypothetical protein